MTVTVLSVPMRTNALGSSVAPPCARTSGSATASTSAPLALKKSRRLRFEIMPNFLPWPWTPA